MNTTAPKAHRGSDPIAIHHSRESNMAFNRPTGFTFNHERARKLVEDAEYSALAAVVSTLVVCSIIIVIALFITTRGAKAKAEPGDPRYSQIEQRSYSAPSYRRAHRSHRAQRSTRTIDANGNSARGVVTVPTAAGINITVSQLFAPKIVSFIDANVAAGRHFKQIHCLNFARTHVSNSLHFSGDACDFRPSPIGRLAGQYGLRDGCSFHDCMHIDNGPLLGSSYSARSRRHHHRHYAAR